MLPTLIDGLLAGGPRLTHAAWRAGGPPCSDSIGLDGDRCVIDAIRIRAVDRAVAARALGATSDGQGTAAFAARSTRLTQLYQ